MIPQPKARPEPITGRYITLDLQGTPRRPPKRQVTPRRDTINRGRFPCCHF